MTIEEGVLEQIKENSNVSDSVNEASTSADVASTQQLIGKVIEEKYHSSLLYSVADVNPLTGTFGSIYAVKKNNVNKNQFKVVKKDVYTTVKVINSGFTVEVLEDMKRVFGKGAREAVGNILGGISSENENLNLIVLLNAESSVKPPLSLLDPDSLRDTGTRIQKKISESVLEINTSFAPSLECFCILPRKWASAFLSSPSYVYSKSDNKSTLFLGRIGTTDFYMNPISNTAGQFTDDYNFDYEIGDSIPDYCYVGIKSKVAGQSSLNFSPYMYEMQYITDPDTADTNVFLYNRYGLTPSPLHAPLEGKSMLHKFEIIEAV